MIIDKIKKEIELAINKNNCNDINFLVEKLLILVVCEVFLVTFAL